MPCYSYVAVHPPVVVTQATVLFLFVPRRIRHRRRSARSDAALSVSYVAVPRPGVVVTQTYPSVRKHSAPPLGRGSCRLPHLGCAGSGPCGSAQRLAETPTTIWSVRQVADN